MAWRDTITIDGVSNEDIGVTLQGSLYVSAPEPNLQIYKIPGRNGNIIETDGTFKNRTAKVSAYIYKDDMVREDMSKVYEWLFSTKGYRKLATTSDPDHFMLASVISGGDIVDKINKMIPFDIVFDCRPERFLNTGDEWLFRNGTVGIRNNTKYDSKPLFKVFGPFRITVNGATVTMTDSDFEGASVAFFDTDLQTITTYDYGDNPVNCIYVSERIVLPANKTSNIIFESTSESDTVNNFNIKPRWWEL